MAEGSTLELDLSMTVQFFPCGHTGTRTRSQINYELKALPKSCLIVQLAGNSQLDDINAGVKLDAVTLPSSSCSECKDNQEEIERQYAVYFW